MTAHPVPLPGLATMAELAAGRAVVECEECHRPLTAREARLWGLGRDCRRQRGERTAPGVGRFDVEQEALPGA
jgi:Family of unknown function (DUF6011)